jgi:predicted glycosyltransferase
MSIMEQPIWIDLDNSPHVPFFEPIPGWQSNYDINKILREIHAAVVR